MKIAYVNSYFTPVITGGQKVEKMICDSLLEKYGEVDYIYNDLKYEDIGSKFGLMIKCLGFYKKLKNYDMCLINSADGFYLLPLLLLLRLSTKVKISNIHRDTRKCPWLRPNQTIKKPLPYEV